MEVLIAAAVGSLFAGALYLILHRSVVKLLLGLGLLGHAANLFLFATSGLKRSAPIVNHGHPLSLGEVADPVPQALILTAIVISFGVLAFTVVLIKLTAQAAQTDDTDALRVSEQ